MEKEGSGIPHADYITRKLVRAWAYLVKLEEIVGIKRSRPCSSTSSLQDRVHLNSEGSSLGGAILQPDDLGMLSSASTISNSR